MLRQTIFLIIFGALSIASGQNGRYFTGLRGMEDSLGNTHLFYRVYEEVDDGFWDYQRNDMFHLDLANASDTLFLESYYGINTFGDFEALILEDIEWINNDPSNYIATGAFSDIDPVIQVFLPDTTYSIWLGVGENVELSTANPQRVYLEGWYGFGFFRSDDGGYSWESDSFGDPKIINQISNLRVSPFDENILFGSATGPSQFDDMVKSTDGGNSYYVVKPFFVGLDGNLNIIFTNDSLVLYAATGYYERIWKSTDAGENWQFVYHNNAPFFVIPDPDNPGTLYSWRDDSIHSSTDGGTTFLPYRTLSGEILNLYKKPASDLLYAATTSKIYEISPTDTTVLKLLDPVGIGEAPASIAEGFALHQNYPNPFNPSTTIAFDLPKSAEIELAIFDIAGRKVATVAAGKYAAGSHTVTFNAENLSTGVYFYRLQTKSSTQIARKMLLLK